MSRSPKRRQAPTSPQWVLIGAAVFIASRIAIEIVRIGSAGAALRSQILWAQVLAVVGTSAFLLLYFWAASYPSRVRIRKLRVAYPDGWIAPIAIVPETAAVLRGLGASLPLVGPREQVPQGAVLCAEGRLSLWVGSKKLKELWATPVAEVTTLQSGEVARLWLTCPSLDVTLTTQTGQLRLPLPLETQRSIRLAPMNQPEIEQSILDLRAHLVSG